MLVSTDLLLFVAKRKIEGGFIQEVIIRPFSEKDALQVKKTALESWIFTYKDIFSKTIIKKFVDTNYNVDLLSNIKHWVAKGVTKFVVAETRDKIVGFAQIGYENYWNKEAPANQKKIKLFRIYLVPEYIGRGIGHRLLESMENFVRQKGKSSYFLNVHKNNNIGLKFYEKQGFVISPRSKDDPIATEYEMEKNL